MGNAICLIPRIYGRQIRVAEKTNNLREMRTGKGNRRKK
jgi:hypothetical protein